MILLLLFILLILMIYAYQKKWNPIRPDFYPMGKNITIGHRGAPMLALENTIESFIKAFETSLNGIELDVQLSKDEELVVFHDWNLKNLTGSSQNIKDISYLEIQHYALKNNFHIPLLSEVLEICPQDKFINIEIKSQNYSNSLLVKKVVKMIRKSNLEQFVVISSFNPFALWFIKKLSPDLSTALLWSNEDSPFLFNSPLWIWFCQPDGFHIDIHNADEKNIRWVRKNNLHVLAFTVNNITDLSKARTLGLDGIFTDDPYLN